MEPAQRHKPFNDALLPHGPAPEPLTFPHFPGRLHAFVWRNWELVEADKLASVVGASAEQIRELATSMGLASSPVLRPGIRSLAYITIIRRNWHLLPYRQIADLLDWDAAKLAFVLREDDFLYHKLGNLKPACDPLRYTRPDEQSRRRAGEIREIVARTTGVPLPPQTEPPFAFLDELTRPTPGRNPVRADLAAQPLRLIYSYFAQYGDPLSEPENDPFPERYLEMLADAGVNGVWLQAVLHKLAPWAAAPELSQGWELRTETLRRLCERTARYGIGVYLYLNEPRAMHTEFYERFPDLRGVTDRSDPTYSALCTSTTEVRGFLTDSAAWVFSHVPALAGAFTISMSENLTHCHSRGYGSECPRCGTRTPAEVTAEVNSALAEGVHRAAPDARFIVWDWAWSPEVAEEAIPRLPKSVWFMSVSEWDTPIVKGGVESVVGEYSISNPGPGPRAQRHWGAASARGLRPTAKMQINNTWELSCVPYIPATHLVAQHVEQVARHGVRDVMLSWTLGGYPSINIDAARRLLTGAADNADEAVRQAAVERFGEYGGAAAVEASRRFGEAFREFPFHIRTVYMGPQQVGPANLFFPEPTGYKATMVGFPYDDLDGWRAVYPTETFRRQMGRLSEGWAEGTAVLRNALDEYPSAELAAHCRVAEAAGLVWRSVCNQIDYIVHRGRDVDQCRDILRDEVRTAEKMLHIVDEDSRIGFEATNHYFFTRCDLLEKIINCRHLLTELDR